MLHVHHHPGAILKEELDARGLSPAALATALRVPSRRISDIVKGKRGVTADTALRLERFFGGDAQFWMNLQAGYDLHCTRREAGAVIAEHVQPAA